MIEKESALLIRDPNILKPFLEQPTIKIAEFITGALSAGVPELIRVGGRLVQGAIKGRLMTQFGREINKLVEDGKIKEDYANTKYGFKSLEELLNFIDSEAPDEERFNAVKSLFFALNSIDVKDFGEEMLRYQLFKIALTLTSSQIIILKTSYDWLLGKEDLSNFGLGSSASGWITKMSNALGHNIRSLVEIDETVLMDKQLLSSRMFPDKSGIHSEDARLTDLGISFCKNLSNY